MGDHEYLRAGVKLVWVVFLPTRNVWAYRAAGTLTADGVLPDFAVPVAELFEGV